VAASHSHVSGDLNGLSSGLLDALESLGAELHRRIYVTSGFRSYAEQAALYANRANNPYPVAAPGTSDHETGDAADVTINGVPIQNAVSADVLEAHGLNPLAGDEVHVTLAGGSSSSSTEPQPISVGGEVADLATHPKEVLDKVGEGVSEVAQEIVKALWGALGTDGPRVLLYIGLVIGGTVLALAGLSRSVGLKPPAAPAGG
jgi:hypothetical protein